MSAPPRSVGCRAPGSRWFGSVGRRAGATTRPLYHQQKPCLILILYITTHGMLQRVFM